MMMTSHDSHAEDILAKNLGCTPGFACYLTKTVSGLQLDSKTIKEKANGSVTVTLSYHVEISRNGGKTTIDSRPISGNQPPLGKNKATNSKNPPKKRKSPSRRRRDRMRFRMFLEKRKKQKIQSAAELSPQTTRAVSTKSPISVQCAPPDDAVITVCRPPTVTLSKSAPRETPQQPDPVFPAHSGSHPCICKLCHAFVDVDPIVKYH